MHFQGKALALLDWHWGKMQTEQAQTRRRGHSIENGVYDASSVESEHGSETVRSGGRSSSSSSFVRSSSMSAISAEPVVIAPPAPRTISGSAHSLMPLPSPHGELAQTPMGLALRRYFANDFSTPAEVQVLKDAESDEAQQQQSISETPAQPDSTANSDNATLESPNDAVKEEASITQDGNTDTSEASETPPAKPATAATASSSSLNSGVVKSSVVNQAGRAMFVKCLNRQRSLETKIKDQRSFDELVDCFNVFLSECIREDDVKAAKTAMILAETFYLPTAAKKKSRATSTSSSASDQSATDSGATDDHSESAEPTHFHHHGGVNRGATRMYLQEEVKKHAIWKNPAVSDADAVYSDTMRVLSDRTRVCVDAVMSVVLGEGAAAGDWGRTPEDAAASLVGGPAQRSPQA